MDKHATSERSSIAVAGGIALIIIVTLVVLGLFARLNLPSNIVTGDGAAAVETAPQSATEAVADATPVVAAPTEAVADATTAESADAGTAITATAAIATAAIATTEVTTNSAAAVETASDGAAATVATAATFDMATLNAVIAKGTCGACHTIPGIDGAIGAVGPNLATIGADAATRIAGYSAQAYLHESIVDPNAFVAPACPAGPCVPGIMLPNLADLLSADEIDMVVGYLSTLGVEAAESKSAGAAVEANAAVTATGEIADATTVAVPADMAALNAIALKGTCVACHTIPGIELATGVIGPNLGAIGVDAATRIAGYSAEEYIRESILDPNAFIAPECPAGDCPAGLMLPNLADLLTPAEIDTMVAYLLTLDGSE